jgi:hypothetical protein
VEAVADSRLSGRWRLVPRGRVRLRASGAQRDSPDTASARTVARVEPGWRAAVRRPAEVVRVVLAARGSVRWPETARDGMPAAPHPARPLPRAGPTKRQQRIRGALNALTAQVDDRDTSRVGRQPLRAV